MENYSLATAGTLQTGADNTNTTFSGTFDSPLSGALLSVTKIGSGNVHAYRGEHVDQRWHADG